MNIRIIAVGKMKEPGFRLAMEEFSKRLSAYCTFSVQEISAHSIVDEALYEKYMEEEGEKILAAIKQTSFVITMEIEGKSLSSEDFAAKLRAISMEGTNEIVFVIGGSNGLSKRVKSRANYRLSFSKMTFPHQLARVMLVEQLYRAMRILAKEPYHK